MNFGLGRLLGWGEVRRREEAEEAEEQERRRTQLAARAEATLQKFLARKYIVVVRERDGRRTDFESALIAGMLERKATVVAASEVECRKLMDSDVSPLRDGVFALVGTMRPWRPPQVSPEGGRTSMDYSCGYRLLSRMESGEAKVEAAGHYHDLSADNVAFGIVCDLVNICR